MLQLLSEHFAVTSTHPMWHKVSSEISSNSPQKLHSNMLQTKTQWPSAKMLLVSDLTWSASLVSARQRMWRIGATCELWELWGRANFQGPYIMCPLADSSASLCKWQCLSMSVSHPYHPLSLFKSASFLSLAPSLCLSLADVILPLLEPPSSLLLLLISPSFTPDHLFTL